MGVETIVQIVYFLVIILFSLSVHESAHAWAADRLGDPTARQLGRVTLNPLPHIDPIGTILFPILLAFSGMTVFGWAKPVPTIARHFRNPRRDQALVAAAGPVSNLMLVVAGLLVAGGLTAAMFAGDSDPGAMMIQVRNLVASFATVNLFLALFNLIPVPPLDGSWILEALLPPSAYGFMETLRRFGPIVLFILLISGGFRYVLGPLFGICGWFLIELPIAALQALLTG